MAIGRRELLGCAALAAGGVLLTQGNRDVALFRDPEAARRIGTRYLALYPEGDVRSLAEALSVQALNDDAAARREHIGARCRQDFATGNTVTVDGWILARSEAQACALVALGAMT